MRGSPCQLVLTLRQLGIIPADAGLTFIDYIQYMKNWDHPRGCGAHSINDSLNLCLKGSSPRMRGSHRLTRQSAWAEGIIPADAGLTEIALKWPQILWDHPRGCGAHTSLLYVAHEFQGSSPRMRGSLKRSRITSRLSGIIPADAGLTRPRKAKRTSVRDHPRGCGAHRVKVTDERPNPGSSPRMRGSH